MAETVSRTTTRPPDLADSVAASGRPAAWSYEQLVDSLGCIVWEGDAQTFQFTYVSKQAERLLGFPVERWTSEPTFWQDHIHPDDRAWAPSFCALATHEKRAHDFEYRMLAADGRIVWLRDIVTVVVADDQPVKLRGVMVDISEQKQMEQDRRNSEAQYRAVFEATTDGLTINTLDGALIEVNPAFAAMHGYTREEMAGMDPRIFIHPDYHAHTPQAFRAFAAGREYTEVYARDVRKDGTVFPVEVHGTRFMYRGEPHVLCIVRDLSGQKRMEQDLRNSEAQYRAVFEAVSDGLVISDLAGNVLEVNPAFAAQLGYTRDELIGMDPRNWVHPDSHTSLVEFLEKVGAGERYYTLGKQVRKDGTVFPAEVYGTPFLYNGRQHTLALIHDITERAQAQELLEQRVEERTHELATLAQVASQVAFGGSLESTLEILCRHVANVTRAVAAAVVLHDPETKTDYIAGSYGLPEGYPAAVNKLVATVGNPPMMGAAVGGQRSNLAYNMRRTFLDSPTYAPLHPFIEQVSWDTVVGVPMKYRNEHVGALLSYHLPTTDIGEAEIGLHTVIADQAAIAVGNARLLAQAQENTRKTAALAQVASQVAFGGSLPSTLDVLCRRVVEVTGGLAAAIILRDGSQQRMVGTWGLPDGYAAAMNRILESGVQLLTQEAFAGQKPVSRVGMRQALLDNPAYASIHGFVAAAEWDTVVAVPMIYRDGTVGVLLSYHAPAYGIDETQLSFHTAIADQAAIAVGNARLLAQAQENTRKTAALAQVASQVAFGGSLPSTLDVLCRRVVEAAGSLAAAVVLREGGQLRIFGSYGLPEGYPAAMNQVLESGTPLMTQPALEGQKPVVIANAREAMLNNPAYALAHQFLAAVPWDILVAVPMVYRDHPVGALLSYYPPTQEIDSTAMTFHTVIADQAAVAVENARLLQDAHDKARLEERQRLARELHDSVTQALFSISLIARSAELLLQREGTHSDAAMEKLADLRQLTQGALAEMRALIFELRPGALEEEGLLEALRKHAAAVQGREMLPVDVRAPAPDDLPRLKPAAEEALYRIAQEALHNVVKHAQATRVEVAIAAQAGFIVLQVRDDGAGFDATQVPAGHMGLGTMRQRTQALGGEYEIESRPGAGTTLTVRVPLAEWQL